MMNSKNLSDIERVITSICLLYIAIIFGLILILFLPEEGSEKEPLKIGDCVESISIEEKRYSRIEGVGQGKKITRYQDDGSLAFEYGSRLIKTDEKNCKRLRSTDEPN